MGEEEKSIEAAVTNPSYPYSLHSSNHPGIILASQILERDNYDPWSHSAAISLSAKNNDMVLSWLLNSIHPDIANSVIYVNVVAEVWFDL